MTNAATSSVAGGAGGPGSTVTGSAAAAAQAATDMLAAKKQARLMELQNQYSLVRCLPFTMAVVIKLNYVPPPPPAQEAIPSEAENNTKMSKDASKANVKGKGKK